MVEVSRYGPPYEAPPGASSSSGWALSHVPALRGYHSRSEKKARVSKSFNSTRDFAYLGMAGEEETQGYFVNFTKLTEGDRR
jgi:hypothetical protein